MNDVNDQALRSITLTSGKMTELQPHYQLINIRGSVSVLPNVHVTKISSHGYSSFHGKVNSQFLYNTGHCTIRGSFVIDEIRSNGHLDLRQGEVNKMKSSGSVVIHSSIKAKHFEATGTIHAPKLTSELFTLSLSGKSQIKRLAAAHIQVDSHKSLFSLGIKKLVCDHIIGKNIQVTNTTANVIEGEHVMIGDHCSIRTLYYSENYSISPKASVTEVIRREA